MRALATVLLLWLGACHHKLGTACEDMCEVFANCGRVADAGQCASACKAAAPTDGKCVDLFTEAVSCLKDKECDALDDSACSDEIEGVYDEYCEPLDHEIEYGEYNYWHYMYWDCDESSDRVDCEKRGTP